MADRDDPSSPDPLRRTVGELLTDSDRLARAVLADPAAVNAAAVVRTWPEVVEAAGQVWQALRVYHRVAVPEEAARRSQESRLERLVLTGQAFHRAARARPWPGAGPAEARLGEAAQNLSRAADLDRRQRPGPGADGPRPAHRLPGRDHPADPHPVRQRARRRARVTVPPQ